MKLKGILFVMYFLMMPNSLLKADGLTTEVVVSEQITLADSIINYGRKYLRLPYGSIAAGRNRFDCSGFTSHVFGTFGYQLRRSSAEQARQFPAISVSELRPGDLVFYQGRSLNGRVGHVGIVVETRGNGQFSFIHASVQEGITITNSSAPYYARRFVSAGRVLPADVTSELNNSVAISIEDKPVVETVSEITTAVSVAAESLVHVVRKGETLYGLSRRYGVSVQEIKRNNGLTSDRLRISQRLYIR